MGTIIIQCECEECKFNNKEKMTCGLEAVKLSDAGYCLNYIYVEGNLNDQTKTNTNSNIKSNKRT